MDKIAGITYLREAMSRKALVLHAPHKEVEP